MKMGVIRFILDIQVSPLLYERSSLMEEPLKYLLYRKCLSQEQYDETAQIAKESLAGLKVC